MPIEHTRGGTIITGESIEYYRICVLKTAVELELKGIRVKSWSVTAQAKREFGIKGNRQKIYDWLCAKVEELRPQQEHIDKTGGGK